MVDSFAKIYTPIVVLAAVCMCTIPWIFGTETGQYWARNGLITIVSGEILVICPYSKYPHFKHNLLQVIACPCALIISTPVTYVAALAACAHRGIIVKGGQHLEGLGRVKSVYFDKTGTLTQGVFALLHLNVVGDTRSRKDVLGYLALMEKSASHPLADAITRAAANEQATIPDVPLEKHTLINGEGITALVDGKAVHVGNKRLFQRLDLYDELPKDVKDTVEEWSESGGSLGFISIEGDGIVGAYCVADKVRDETASVVAELKRRGIEITMLTGDQGSAAISIGNQIGLELDQIKSELLPEDKLAIISDKVNENKLKKKCWKAPSSIVMVGDGVNDAPCLARADVSVAMGEGAALASKWYRI